MSRKKKSKNYFTEDTEKAIIKYNLETKESTRNEIYNSEIHYAFTKLAENIIHTFKFYYTEDETIEDLQHEVISFLLSKIHLFKPEKGAKAYSYFGTIAKRYLIITNTKNYKRKLDKAPVEGLNDTFEYSYEMNNVEQEDGALSEFIDGYIEYITEHIFELFPKQEDARIADAILELFRKRVNLDILNKKALYIYIREQVDAKTPKITKVANELYDIFKENYINYLQTDELTFRK
jgi:DNA-directed RNA polymerase specialized sigma24 family protein